MPPNVSSKTVSSTPQVATTAATDTRIEYRRWTERCTAADGVLPDRVRYSRKSTESEDRQATSHDQQAVAMDAKWRR